MCSSSGSSSLKGILHELRIQQHNVATQGLILQQQCYEDLPIPYTSDYSLSGLQIPSSILSRTHFRDWVCFQPQLFNPINTAVLNHWTHTACIKNTLGRWQMLQLKQNQFFTVCLCPTQPQCYRVHFNCVSPTATTGRTESPKNFLQIWWKNEDSRKLKGDILQTAQFWKYKTAVFMSKFPLMCNDNDSQCYSNSLASS